MAEQSDDLTLGAKALPLLIASGDPAVLNAIRALVANAEPPVEVTPSDALDAALAQDAQTPVIVPVRLPLDHLHKALQAGDAPGTALDSWCKDAEALLKACRKARRRVVMIDAGMLTARPAAAAKALGARLGLRIKAVAEGQAARKSELSPIHSAIAASLLATDVRATELADELEAMIAGPVGPRTPSRDEVSTAAQEAASLAEERDLLRETLQQMLSETERLRGEKAELEKKLDVTDAARADLEARLEKERNDAEAASQKAAQDTASLTEERDLLRENLQHMLSETERLIAAKSDESEKHLLKAQLDAVNRQIEEAREARRMRESLLGTEILKLVGQLRNAQAREKEARDEIARIHASTSWKVTVPMRAMKKGLRRS